MCQPWANEITEPLVLTVYVCKLELRGKAIVLQSRFRRTRFSRGQQRTKRKEKTSFHKTKTNLGASAAAWFQGGTHFGQWRIQRWRIIRACSWKSLSRNIAFFCFLRSHYFFFLLTADTSRDEALWELIEPWAHVTFGEILPSIREDKIHRFSSCLVLVLFCFLSKDFSPFWSALWRRNELA